MEPVLISDDEAVALALLEGGRWRAVLPTVDLHSGERLLEAGIRGRRSLSIRRDVEMDGGSGTEPGLRDLVRPAVSGEALMQGYVANNAARAEMTGISFSYFAGEGPEGLLVITRPNGVHEVQQTAREAARSFVGAAVEAARNQDSKSDRALVLIAPGNQTLPGVIRVVTREGFEGADFDRSGADLDAVSPVSGIDAVTGRMS